MTQPQQNTLETILVVEDDVFLRDAVCKILKLAGFRVLAADGGNEAIQAESITQGTIHLLLSDVMMPDISGPVVAQRLTENRPEMRVMLMSGYPGAERLFLKDGWHFIAKPFLAADLVERVKQALHTPDRSQAHNRFDTRIQPHSS